MPNYNYKCVNCNAKFEKQLTIENRNLPLQEPCPTCDITGVVSRCFDSDSMPAVGDPFYLTTKTPSDFKNHVLTPMKKFYPNNKINI